MMVCIKSAYSAASKDVSTSCLVSKTMETKANVIINQLSNHDATQWNKLNNAALGCKL